MVSRETSNVEVNIRKRKSLFAPIKILIIKKVFQGIILEVSLLHKVIFMMDETGYLVKFR